jgi:hypothetical protein
LIWAGGPFSILERGRDFILFIIIQTSSGAQPISCLWVLGALSPLVKNLEHEAHCCAPFSAEMKNVQGFVSTPPYAFLA